MKISSKLFLATTIATLFFACNNNSENKMAQLSMADSTSTQLVSSSAAVEHNKDSSRKFIRVADLKFKVSNVVNATYAIEKITNDFSGFVTYTNLNSVIDNKTTIPVSADSSLETTYYTIVNTMTIRVPNTKLDTALRSMAILIDYLDHRIIKADDVALSILANNLTQARSSKSAQRLTNAIDMRGKKLNETATAEELLLSKQERSDNAHISNLSLQDQINFSTITLEIYQRQAMKRELISNDKNISAYTVGLGRRLGDAFKTGWEMWETLILFIAQLWTIILLAIILFVVYRKYGKSMKK